MCSRSVFRRRRIREIPHEQSIKGGPGENGGIMCLDGPTFVATEGWDWIPAIRDRDSGLWQKVVLKATGLVKIGDAQVVTALPLPDTSKADVEITVPLENSGDTPVSGTLTASFDQTTVTENVTVAPGGSTVKLTPGRILATYGTESAAVVAKRIRQAGTYTLKLTFVAERSESDVKHVRFGIREITYELSLFDETGHLRRVESSTKARR